MMPDMRANTVLWLLSSMFEIVVTSGILIVILPQMHRDGWDAGALVVAIGLAAWWWLQAGSFRADMRKLYGGDHGQEEN